MCIQLSHLERHNYNMSSNMSEDPGVFGYHRILLTSVTIS